MAGFDKSKKYVFVEEKYFEDVKNTLGKIGSIEKSFAKKHNNKKVKVVNEKTGMVDNQYYVNYKWCKEVE